ncbi:hypothetical protein RJ640_022231 [Escallonia rubra]|uniref:Uncharacterized protein n=1 Tax=Escallonia rubra TaxID=112253 RepID=A0AA88Q8R7_9ASTE|nr:hypothetical protein RJ640_022231 [Escallonia rubra]
MTNEPGLRDIRVTFEEFYNFVELRKRLLPLSMALFSHGKVNGLLTKRDFQRATYHVCGISLTDNVVDMIIYVFDDNRDRKVAQMSSSRVLQRREGDILQPRDAVDGSSTPCDCLENPIHILRLEFAHYDFKSLGTISAKDFALSMVASADMKNINKFLDRVDEITNEPGLRDIRVTFEEFNNFAELHERLLPLSMALFSHGKVNGLLTKRDFQRATYHVCSISLTDNVVDMIFYGNLSSDEFLRVLQRREGDRRYAMGLWRQRDLLFCRSKLPSTTPTELLCQSGKTAIAPIVVTDLESPGVENQLWKLRNLEMLGLRRNHFDSRVLSSINGLASLRMLDLSENHLNSSIHLKGK